MDVKNYKKKNLHEHVLSRPEIYIGSTEKNTETIFGYNITSNKIEEKELEYVPAFVKLFDEILVNAIDHSVKDETVSTIKAVIEDDYISIYNDGTGIPVVLHPEYNCYVPELIFGNLLTSSNYNDDVERITGGLNGMGSKAVNIFSKKFIVETFDGNLNYKQEFSNNMYEKKKPSITKKNSTKQYTKITYYPDLAKFKMTSIHPKELLYKRIYDTVACTNDKVSVYLNGKKIHKNSNKFKDYLSLYDTTFVSTTIEKKYTWEIAVGLSTSGFKQVSFVNGVCTIHGGKHVDYVVNQLVKKLTGLLLSKKKIQAKANYIKDNLFVVIKSIVANPKFSSQSKECLVSQSKDFISFDIPDDFVLKFYKTSDIGEIVAEIANNKDKKSLDKGLSNTKKSTIVVQNLEDATYAGTSKSGSCSLMLTEGLSAKTFAISGMSVIGRKYYGCFSLKGKPLNIREASAKQLLNNEEIINLKKIIGLQNSKTYKTDEEFNTLRYGSIIILTDADVDGKHITGLLINMFHYFWPELLKRPGFIKRLQTPIVKVSKGKKSLEFYSECEYRNWQKNNPGWNTKYYKGLGTSTSNEAKEIFKNFDKNTITYFLDDKTDYFMKLAFDKKNADKRKEWLKNYDPNYEFVIENSKVSFTDNIDKELIHFSAYDNIRSIPNVMDGLKPSQRKVLYTVFKRNQTKEIKVAQLGSAVAEITDYHHGEASLYSTIVGMAQDYPGSNNINLLVPCGQFGSRGNLGKDAASPRYIFTHISIITNKIFVPEDNNNNVIDYNYSDNQEIEPKYYVPSIPMILVNGAIGIGTGYSTNIPQYNPEDIIENIRNKLANKPLKKLIPYYKGFEGTIVPDGDNFIMSGVVKQAGNSLVITEIPTTTAIDNYKDFIINHLPNCRIVNNSTENKVNIEVVFPSKQEIQDYIKNGKEFIYKDLKLCSKINTGNFYLFDCEQKLQKYASPNEIIEYFTENKLKFLQKRKDYLTDKYSTELEILKNKKRFLEEIMDDVVVVYKKRKQEIENILKNRKYYLLEGTYNYLTSMNISSFNAENLEALTKKIEEIQIKLDAILSSTPKSMFVDDLNMI